MEKVLFTSDTSSNGLVKIFDALGVKLNGRVAVKLHSGEAGNQNYLKPDYVLELINHVNGTVVECNTAYEGERDTTEKHQKLMEDHGWTKACKVDILDAEGPDLEIPIENGLKLTKNYVGKNIENYDSVLVLSHFKGHPMGGYGGALKQLSIGFASGKGKRYIHCVGKENGSFDDMFQVKQIDFLDSMADAAKTIHDKFKDNIVYINVMTNMSVDCDCCVVAEDPCMKDIGILASTDPVAIDQACINLVYKSDDPGRDHLVERIESRQGTHTIESAEKLGIGSREYELVEI
ncbi:MAG: DUF362 domain-containing protein [Erysipelotrichales bacterium]|nr:DUF362 domain-containing protein [Erysipelotrichales bacterium]